MGLIVQLLMLGGLLAAVIAALVACIKMMASKDGRGKFGKFLLIQVFLFAAVAGSLYLLGGRDFDPIGFLMISVLLTLFANLPLAIVAKIVGVILGTSRRPKDGPQ